MPVREMAAETSREALVAMLKQESTSYRNPLLNPYRQIQNVQFPGHKSIFDEDWRLKISQWKFQVVDHFGFEREVVSISMNFLDRMIMVHSESESFGTHVRKKELQLMAVTSLYIAIKLHGTLSDQPNYTEQGERRSLRVTSFVVLSQNQHTVEDIEGMERRVLDTLGWLLHPPTPLLFVSRLLHLIPRWSSSSTRVVDYHKAMEAIFEKAQYLTEISACVSDLNVLVKPSTIAFASILKSIESNSEQESVALPRKVFQTFLENVARVLSLRFDSLELRQACLLLEEACPLSETGVDDTFVIDDPPPQGPLDNDALPCPSPRTHSVDEIIVQVQTPLQHTISAMALSEASIVPDPARKTSPVSVSDLDNLVGTRKRSRSPYRE